MVRVVLLVIVIRVAVLVRLVIVVYIIGNCGISICNRMVYCGIWD